MRWQGILVQILRFLVGTLEKFETCHICEGNAVEVSGQLNYCDVEPVQNFYYSLLHVEAPLQLIDGKFGQLIGELLYFVKKIHGA